MVIHFYFYSLLKIMIGRTRNYSLKTLYHPKAHIKQEEEPLPTKPKLTMVKILPTIAENRQLQKSQAKELGINIKKFQNIVSQNDSENQEELIRTAYFVIKSFSEVDNNFKDIFADLHYHLKQFLFLNEPDICSKYHLKGGITYRKAVRHMDKTSNEWIAKKNQAIAALEEQIVVKEQASKNQIERLNIECFRLNGEVEKYKKIANVEYVRSLELKIANLKETVSSQEEDYKVLAKKNEECSKQIQFLRSEVNDLEVNNSILQQKVYDLSILKEKSEIYLLKTKDKIEQLKNRMESIKEVISKVEKQNETLVAERVKLVNRAAVSFEDLTPRPKYSDYFALDNNTNLNPTNTIFKGMIQSFDISQKNEAFEKYFLAKKSRKLMEIEAIREKTVFELMQSKAQINKIQ